MSTTSRYITWKSIRGARLDAFDLEFEQFLSCLSEGPIIPMQLKSRRVWYHDCVLILFIVLLNFVDRNATADFDN